MYAKIFTQIYDGTLCTRGPWQALVTFQQLLVLADQDGNVDMTAVAIARRTTIPADIIETGIEALMQPDPESRTPTLEGRRIVPLAEGRGWGWHIVNYANYRKLKREEDRREYHRSYYQERKLKKSTLTQQSQPIQPIAKAEAKAKAVDTGRGTRLPTDWKPTEEDIQYCKNTRPDLDPPRVADDFRDYWIAVPGTRGVKMDWPATWRSFVRRQYAAKGAAAAEVREWHETKAGVEAKAKELGLPPCAVDEQQPAFRARVMRAAKGQTEPAGFKTVDQLVAMAQARSQGALG